MEDCCLHHAADKACLQLVLDSDKRILQGLYVLPQGCVCCSCACACCREVYLSPQARGGNSFPRRSKVQPLFTAQAPCPQRQATRAINPSIRIRIRNCHGPSQRAEERQPPTSAVSHSSWALLREPAGFLQAPHFPRESDGTGILNKEPNATGSRPSDLIGLCGPTHETPPPHYSLHGTKPYPLTGLCGEDSDDWHRETLTWR